MKFKYKLILCSVLIALLSWQFFRYVDYVLNVITPESFAFDFETIAVVNFVVLVSIISLALAMFREKKWALVTAGIVGLIFIALFGANYINLIGVGVVALLFLYARFAGVEEIDQRTKVNSRMIVRRGAIGVVLAFFVLISFVAYQSPVATGIANAERLPTASQQLLRSVVNGVIGGQIETDEQERESIISEVVGRTFQQINNALKPYFKYTPPLLAFGLFLILWGLSWFFIQLSVFVGMGIFWVLKRTGFVKIEETEVKAERLII